MTTAPNIIITPKEAKRLNQARDVLEAIQKRCRADGRLVVDESYAHGMLDAYADAAGDAIFDVLNVAHSYLECKAANDAIDQRLADREAAREALNA